MVLNINKGKIILNNNYYLWHLTIFKVYFISIITWILFLSTQNLLEDYYFVLNLGSIAHYRYYLLRIKILF